MWAVQRILPLKVQALSQEREHKEPKSPRSRGVRHNRIAALLHSQQGKLPARQASHYHSKKGEEPSHLTEELTVDGPHILESFR